MQKILFIIESLSCGGAEKSLVTLLQNIDYSKFEVDLLLIKKGGEFENLVSRQYMVGLDIPSWGNKVHIIPNAGHCPPFEAPDQLAVLIRDFALDVSRQFS